MINKTNKHDKGKAANSKNYAHSLNKSDKVIQDEADIYRQIVEIDEDLEMEEFAKEVEDTEVRNMVMINKSVDSFVENAYKTINRSEETNTPKCHECNLKDQVISEFYELMYTNDTKDQPLSIAKNRVNPVANNEVPQKNYCCCVGQELQEMY